MRESETNLTLMRLIDEQFLRLGAVVWLAPDGAASSPAGLQCGPQADPAADASGNPARRFKEMLLYRFQRLFRTGDLSEDFAGGLCPDEGLGAGVVVFEIVHDGALQFGDAFEDAAANAFFGDLGKKPLNHVEP